MTKRLPLVVLLWLVFSSLLGLGLRGDWSHTWKLVGINPLNQPFGDIRSIPEAVKMESYGIDPYSVTSGAMNYPSVWIRIFSALDLSNHVVTFELLMISLYLLCLSHLIMWVPSLTAAWVVSVCALSSASFLAVERGNNDLLAFSLTYMAAQSSIAILACGLLTFAAILKFYPAIALLGSGIANRRKSLIYACSALVVGIYVIFERSEIGEIEHNTPHAFKQSYGVNSLTAGIESLIHGSVRGYVLFSAILVLLVGYFFGRNIATTGDRVSGASRIEILFAVFCCIFLGTFLLTPNYEYRLIFLIPLFPFYVETLKRPALRPWAAAAIALGIVSLDNHVIHDFDVLKAVAYISRVALFAVDGVFLGWLFTRLLMIRATSRLLGPGFSNS